MTGLINDEQLQKLLELLYLREKKYEQQQKAAKKQTICRTVTWFEREVRAYNRQQKCSHLKGANGPRQSRLDYNVGMHTFINGETKIWCLSNCGWNVWNRPGWQFKWTIGMRMFQNSTNGKTSSKVPPNTRILSTLAKI